ncbi:MAG TPA: alginate lyase family protein [Dongiaceae bacterium]|jgi:hypothetical protein
MHRLLAPPKPVAPIPAAPAVDIAELQARYARSSLAREADRFVLYRIIGNDLYPRHSRGMSRANVQFILQHEPPLADCEKRWVVNRIVDAAEERAIIALLERHGQSFLHIPFVREDYARIGWDLDCFADLEFLLDLPGFASRSDEYLLKEARTRHSKNAYVMNNNGARNAALRAGRSIAKWVLPWDGNCFLTQSAWSEIRAAVLAQLYLRYFVVPMARTVANGDLLEPGYRPQEFDEPQILFRRDAPKEFDPRYVYGRRSKVELLWRLGVPGPWDRWKDAEWDCPRRSSAPAAPQYATCGWVNRLESGQHELERVGSRARQRRGEARCSAIITALDLLDEEIVRERLDPARLTVYRDSVLERLRASGESGPLGEIVASIVAGARAAIARGTFSVLDKTGCAPSGDRQDYWHPAPHWWPNPDSPDGMPYLHRDGQPRPGTQPYEPGSEQFDRSNLQRMLEGAAACALAWSVAGERTFADHGAALIRRWFIDPNTRMNPHMRFAQPLMISNDKQVNHFGIIELRDLPMLLDAARLLERAGSLDPADRGGFHGWLAAYRDWLLTSEQGAAESRRSNNHGTFFDLQMAAVAAYLGDAALLNATFRRCRARISVQFETDGAQPQELRRPKSLHYCCFNLQGWIGLATHGARCGEDLWQHRSAVAGGIVRGLEWLTASTARRQWAYPQSDPFEWKRLVPLNATLARLASDHADDLLELHRTAPEHSLHYGIPLYWYL